MDKIIDIISDYESIILSGESDEFLATAEACGPA